MNSGIKKRPYYLMENMRYTFPYIKSYNQNPSDIPQLQPQPDKYDNTLLYEEIDHEDEFEREVKVESCASPYGNSKVQFYEDENMETFVSPLASPLSEAITTQDPSCKLTHSVDTQTSGFQQLGQRIDPVDALSHSPDLPNELQNDPKKMFLLSLLPDVYAMDDKQTRKFKRGVLQLVDDILSDT